jgi:SfnB family sulfur acquisition oxidoreductase
VDKSHCEKRSGHVDLVEAARSLTPILARDSAARDRDRMLPKELMTLICRSGIPAARVSKACGGQEVPYSQLVEIMMYLGEGDPNLAQALQPHFFMIDWFRLEARPEQQSYYYAKVLDGIIMANAFAERGVGTVGETKTRLSRENQHYVLNGTKFYSTGSLFAGFIYSTAVRDDNANVAVIFPIDRDGVEVVDDWDGMGQRTTASGTTHLRGVTISPDEVVELSGRRTFIGAASQLTHAAIDVGIARAALADGIEYGRTKARPSGDSGVSAASDDPYIIHTVGEMSVAVHTAEAMMRRAAVVLDRAIAVQLGVNPEAGNLEQLLAEASIAVAEAKAVAESASLRVSEMMYRVGGASMTLRNYDFDRHWRNARTHTTHDPVAYKYRAVGDFYLNNNIPKVSYKL